MKDSNCFPNFLSWFGATICTFLCAAMCVCLCIATCACLCCLSACSQGSVDGSLQDSDAVNCAFDVEDLSGRTAHFEQPANRVVAIQPSDAEVLYALGAEETIVGRGTYCDYPEQVKQIEDVGAGETLNIENIIATKPDCVFMSKMATKIEQVNSLENAGIKVIANQPNNIEDTYKYIEILGKVTGKDQQAQKLVSDMKEEFQKISDSAKQSEKFQNTSIYFELSPLEYGLWVAGSDTFMNDFCYILSIKNCFDDVSGWSQVSQEQVIAKNPDYIVSVTMDDGQDNSESIYQRDNWGNIEAIKNRHVTCISNDLITRPGPRMVDGLKQLYEFISG